MTSLTLRATGAANPGIVWERYVDTRRWPQWAPQIQRVEASKERLATGVSGTVHAGLLPRPTIPVSFEVLALDEDAREWSWRAHVGPVALELDHGVDAREGGCTTWLRVQGPLPVVLAYAPLARVALSRLVRA